MTLSSVDRPPELDKLINAVMLMTALEEGKLEIHLVDHLEEMRGMMIVHEGDKVILKGNTSAFRIEGDMFRGHDIPIYVNGELTEWEWEGGVENG